MIGLIVARSKNNVIGKDGRIPWKIEGEQKQFKELTTGNIVVMGRKSYEEIGHPLPNRKTIVVSKSKKLQQKRRAVHSKEKNVMQLDGEKTLYAKMKDKAITMFLVMALSYRIKETFISPVPRASFRPFTFLICPIFV